MNRRARFRTTVFLLIIALVMGIFSFRLYKVQSTVDEVALQQADSVTIEKSKKMMGQMESVLGADSTIASLVDDIVTHYESNRASLLTGKAMIVAYSRPIAMKIYEKILELRPDWTEKVKVVSVCDDDDGRL